MLYRVTGRHKVRRLSNHVPKLVANEYLCSAVVVARKRNEILHDIVCKNRSALSRKF